MLKLGKYTCRSGAVIALASYFKDIKLTKCSNVCHFNHPYTKRDISLELKNSIQIADAVKELTKMGDLVMPLCHLCINPIQRHPIRTKQ